MPKPEFNKELREQTEVAIDALIKFMGDHLPHEHFSIEKSDLSLPSGYNMLDRGDKAGAYSFKNYIQSSVLRFKTEITGLADQRLANIEREIDKINDEIDKLK